MRITLLHGFILAATTAKGSLLQELVDLVVKGATQDKVANVRMVAARGLQQLVTSDSFDDDSLIQGKIKPALTQKLSQEDDADVRHSMQVALDHMK